MYVMSPPLKLMIDTKKTHMRNVRNEPYAFVAYDWRQEEELTNYDRQHKLQTNANQSFCVEVLRPNQPIRLMSSAVRWPNPTFSFAGLVF